MRKNDGPTGDLDPRALIFESYRIEGIVAEDCRSIFFDWALGVEAGRDMKADAAELLAFYREDFPDHPMTAVLSEAMTAAPGRRRKGRRGGHER